MGPSLGQADFRQVNMAGKAIFSGEPLPQPPKAVNAEHDAFFRKLMDYLRRLAGKIDQYAVGGSATDTYVGTISGDTNQALGTAYESIEWTQDIHKDAAYEHSTTSNQDKITILQNGLYLILCDITVVTGPTFPVQARVKLVSPDGFVKYSLAEINAIGTLSLAVTVPLVSGAQIYIVAQDSGGTGGNVIEPDGTRITIVKLSDLISGGTAVVPGSGWDGGVPIDDGLPPIWAEEIVDEA